MRQVLFQCTQQAQRSAVCAISVQMHQDQRVGRAVTGRLSLSDTEGCQPGRGELTGISYLWPVLSSVPAPQSLHTHYQRHKSLHF